MNSTFYDAVMAYEKFCKKNAIIFCQPIESSSEIDRHFVYLKNTNGDIGKYEINTGRITVDGF